MNRIRFKAVSIAAASLFVAMACGNGNQGSNNGQLAADQTLRLPYTQDVVSLDPGHAEWATDIPIIDEVFSGLLRTDDSLKLQPDIATAMPDVSSDGKTYTFKLKHNAKFSNGDPVTAKDFIYSWTRAAWLNDDYEVMVDPIQGAPDVASHKTKQIAGLTAPDDYTLKVTLSTPAGYWLTEVGLWTTKVVDQKVIGDYTDANNKKNDDWWQDPTTLIGSGPFKMTQRTAKASMAFEPVAGWWGGSTGALKKIEITVGEDSSAAVKKFESGGYDMIAWGDQTPGPDDVLRYKGDATKKDMLHLYNGARSTWVSFNMVKGPLAVKQGLNIGDTTGGLGDDPNKPARTALSQAIDRAQLVDVACAKGATCQVATGGWVAKGLKGYLGDNADPTAKFDGSKAKSDWAKWDPDGSKAKQLSYTFNANASNQKIAENLQSQWRANLGAQININALDLKTFSAQRKASAFPMNRGSWGADYDHPQDWYDNMAVCSEVKSGGSQGMAYCNPKLDSLVQKANQEDISKSLNDYIQAGKLMIQDVPMATLIYGAKAAFLQKYLQGYSYNGLYDTKWEDMKILKH